MQCKIDDFDVNVFEKWLCKKETVGSYAKIDKNICMK